MPSQSILVVAMIVVGGLGSLSGAMLGAVYLIGFPAIFGASTTVQYLTSGIGLLAFLLFLPGGLGTALSRAADTLTALIRRMGFVQGTESQPGLGAEEIVEPVGAGR